MKTQYKIGIDCRLAGKRHAGIGRYIENLIIRLPNLAKNIEWVYFFYDQEQAKEIFETIKPQQQNLQFVFTPIRHYSFAEQVKLPKIFKHHKLDLLHVPHFNAPIFYSDKLIVTIHDLLWHQQKGLTVTTLKPWQYWLKYLAYRFITYKTVQHADQILVPAKTIKQTLTNYYPSAQNKIKVTKEGIDENFSKIQNLKFHPKVSFIPAEFSFKNSGSEIKINNYKSKQLIYVGSLYPHKNIQLVIKALKDLPQYNLKIVGSRNIFQDKYKKLAQKLNLTRRIIFVGYLTDQELIEELKQSFALVQPSLSEGFGLTGVEAMSAGLPVLASDIEIFKEIYQDAPIYFDPHDPSSFIAAVKKLEKTDRKKVINKGFAIVKNYDWDKMVNQTLSVYEKILN